MRGRICVVTGANAGLGYESIRKLARNQAEIIMICRSPEKADYVRKAVISETGNPNIHLFIADLSSQEDVRNVATAIAKRWEKVDVLMNNAAMVLSNRILTEKGIEMQFAVNHLSHFLLTHCLMPCLAASPHARVVNISSRNHWFGKIHFGNLTMDGKYQLLLAYAQSKLANVLFTYELNRRLNEEGIRQITTHCIDPGGNFTDIGSKSTNKFHAFVWKVRRSFAQHPSKGAATQVFVASSPKLNHISGKYWRNSKEWQSAPHSYDENAARKLWQISEVMCDIEDYFRPSIPSLLVPQTPLEVG